MAGQCAAIVSVPCEIHEGLIRAVVAIKHHIGNAVESAAEGVYRPDHAFQPRGGFGLVDRRQLLVVACEHDAHFFCRTSNRKDGVANIYLRCFIYEYHVEPRSHRRLVIADQEVMDLLWRRTDDGHSRTSLETIVQGDHIRSQVVPIKQYIDGRRHPRIQWTQIGADPGQVASTGREQGCQPRVDVEEDDIHRRVG